MFPTVTFNIYISGIENYISLLKSHLFYYTLWLILSHHMTVLTEDHPYWLLNWSEFGELDLK
jgi:hypothetical protein